MSRFLDTMPGHFAEYEKLLTGNPIWLARTKGVALLSKQDAIALGVTGPVLRAAGVKWDLRKSMPYAGYDQYDFEVPVGEHGDAFDRYLVRLEEMRQAVRICRQAIVKLREIGPGDYRLRDYKYVLPPKEDVKTSMEALIHHFKIVAHGFFPPVGEAYQAIEAPKGELGFYFVSDGTPEALADEGPLAVLRQPAGARHHGARRPGRGRHHGHRHARHRARRGGPVSGAARTPQPPRRPGRSRGPRRCSRRSRRRSPLPEPALGHPAAAVDRPARVGLAPARGAAPGRAHGRAAGAPRCSAWRPSTPCST